MSNKGILEKIKKKAREIEKNEIEKVESSTFSPSLRPWMKEYEEVGLRENIFVFRWCYEINRNWHLFDISSQDRDKLTYIKTLFNLFIVLIDDISEEKNRGEFLEYLLRIPVEGQEEISKESSEWERKYFDLTRRVWNEISRELQALQLFDEYNLFYEFDFYQLISAVRYGKIITDHPLACNETEYWIYFPSSMQIMINADMDLMAFPDFDKREVGEFREYILTLQKMARIGNWITTWEREVKEGDMTSVLIPLALQKNIISKRHVLSNSSEDIIKKIKESGLREDVLEEWEDLYDIADEKGNRISSIDNGHVLGMFEYLLAMHIISENLK